jgi:hypothetical protein
VVQRLRHHLLSLSLSLSLSLLFGPLDLSLRVCLFAAFLFYLRRCVAP